MGTCSIRFARTFRSLAVAASLALAGCSGTVDMQDDGGGGGGDGAGTGGDPGAADDLSTAELELIDLINEERAARDLDPVLLRTDLNCAAERHSDDIGESRSCSHDGSDGSTPSSRVNDCGGPGWSGEIVACGQGTPRAAVDAWIGSPGHNQIMFTPGQKTIGVAVHNNFWTAIFDQR